MSGNSKIEWTKNADGSAGKTGSLLRSFRKGGDDKLYLRLKDRKGSDMYEWPLDLRVREYPKETR